VARVLLACDHELTRNNGILRFMIEASYLLRTHPIGHQVDLLTDNPTIEDCSYYFDNIYSPNKFDYNTPKPSKTTPIEYDERKELRLQQAYLQTAQNYDLIITNDIHSALAFDKLDANAHHYVHTAALISKENWTFLSDDFIKREQEFCKNNPRVYVPTDWLRKHSFKQAQVLPLPLSRIHLYKNRDMRKRQGVLFIGEGTLRKGADDFVGVMNKLSYPARIIASTEAEVKFNIKVKTQECFTPQQDKEKQQFIQQSRVMYYPSRSETISYVVLEAALSQPVVLAKEYAWTEQHKDWAYIVPYNKVSQTIQDIYMFGSDQREHRVEEYLDKSRLAWGNLI